MNLTGKQQGARYVRSSRRYFCAPAVLSIKGLVSKETVVLRGGGE